MPRLGVVCESDFDLAVLAELVAKCCQHHPETTITAPEFVGIEPGTSNTQWRRLNEINSNLPRRLPVHGHFRGAPGEQDAHQARLALRLFVKLSSDIRAVVLVRDSDGVQERRDGLEQARRESGWPFDVCIALCQPKIECWILTAFQPRNTEEQTKLELIRQNVGFSPQTEALRLTHTDGGWRDAKRVLRELVGDNQEEKLRVIRSCNLESLLKRGSDVSVTRFVRDEMMKTLLPLLRDSV